MLKRLRPDLISISLLLLFPLILFFQVTLGGKTMLPVDNLTQYEPWASVASDYGFEGPAHNALLSDLVLQNYAWKRYLTQSVSNGEIPLWTPTQFGGVPFLAAGQNSSLYPFTAIFFLLPLWLAYGWFTLLHFWLAGVFTYAFTRSFKLSRPAALTAGVVYQLSLSMTTSAVFPMVIAGAIWLPLTLLAVKWIIERKPLFEQPTRIPWIVLGGSSVGMTALAGHPEVLAYSLLIAAGYTLWLLTADVLNLRGYTNIPVIEPDESGIPRKARTSISAAVAVLAMALIGITLGAIQLIPQYELVSQNFREGSTTLAEVRDYAYKPRRVLTFALPDFYGNPSHHSYRDVFTWETVPATQNAVGQPIDKIEWGLKNYVEGAAYVGILPLILAVIGMLGLPLRRIAAWREQKPTALFFVALGMLSLAFVFGTPLYAIIYYLPGLNQLHTPFRWVWPLTLCVAFLSAIGLDTLTALAKNHTTSFTQLFVRWTATGLMAIGAAIVAGTVIARFAFSQLESTIDGVFRGLALADHAFLDARMFFSYEAPQVLWLGVLLLISGALLRQFRNKNTDGPPIVNARVAMWVPLFIALDLLVAAWGFMPAVEPDLLSYVPPEVEFLQQDTDPWRFTTFDPNGTKPFNANLGWYFDFEDIRGYESIITKQYVDYMALIEPQGELIYNRVAPLNSYSGLDSPLLDLLNVKYVLTTEVIESPKYQLVFEDSLRIYENLSVVPRAYAIPIACSAWTNNFAKDALARDPRTTLFLEHSIDGHVAGTQPLELPQTTASDCAQQSIAHAQTENDELFLSGTLTAPSMVVLNDSFYPGWKAFITLPDGTEDEIDIFKANDNFRAVAVEQAGDFQVRFKYSPNSFKLGGFASATVILAMIFMLGVWAWQTFYREDNLTNAAQRVAKNSLTLTVLNLFNRAIDLVFAMFYLRFLGPASAGNYTTAVVMIGWFDIITNFGLNTWLMREASRDKDNAQGYLGNTTLFRLVLGGLSLPIFVGSLWLYQGNTGNLGDETVIAILLLAVGMLFSSVSTGLSALFYANEKAEYPAGIATFTTIMKVALGAGALLLGFGIIGLAGVSIITNLITLAILLTFTVRLFFKPKLAYDKDMQGQMLRESFPLMINHLLATLFFKVDVPMLRTMRGDAEVGRYGTAYKFIDAFNIIPAFFTLSLFPIMSAQAREDRPALGRTYYLAIKLLVAVAVPTAILGTIFATPLINLLGGEEYLPDGALALQLMVWSMPFGWINSVTQYVLIALDRQKSLIYAFVIAVSFNLIANLLFIPVYGFRAAAVSTILSELILGIAFQYYIYKDLGRTPWWRIFKRLGLACAALLGLTWLLTQIHPFVGLLVGGLVYLLALPMLAVFDERESEVLSRVLPGGIAQKVQPILKKLPKLG